MVEHPHHRRGERQRLKRLLLAGRSILMLAPRRVGKTWLMKRVEEDLTAEERICIRIDLEGMRTEQEFLRALCQEIDKRQAITSTIMAFLKTKLQQFKGGVAGDTLAQMVGGVDPRLSSETLVAALNQIGGRTVVMIDEFSLFILEHATQDPDATRALLYHLRRLQQEFTNVSWFLTGSIGLDVVARRFGLEGALLDLDPETLAPFTREEARSYLAEQAAENLVGAPYVFEEDAFEHLVQELGWLSPFYLYHIARNVRPAPVSGPGGPVATQADVARSFDTLLTPNHRVVFAPWSEHIRKNFPAPESALLQAILAKCSEHPDGEQEGTLLAHLNPSPGVVTQRTLTDLLAALTNDGYIMKDDARWRFRSGLLRRYWLEYIV